MDDCELSFVSGRLKVDFSRRGKLVQSRVLDIDAVERFAEQLDNLDPRAELDGGVVLEREYARSVSRQLRALAAVLRVARELSEAEPARPTPSTAGGRPRRLRITTPKRS